MELLAKAANASFGSLADFRKRLEKEGFLNVSRRKFDTGRFDNKTIEESVTQLYGMSHLSEEQQCIMRLFSIFTPEKVIYGAIEEWAEFDADAVDGLVKLGWLDRAENGFVIHQIIRDSLAEQVGGNLRIEDYGELLDSVININSYIPRDLEYTEVQERLVLAENVAEYLDNRVKEIVEVNGYSKEKEYFLKRTVMLFDGIAGVYEIHSNYVQALYYFRKAYELNMIFDPNHPCTGGSYNNMGRIYHALGDDANAEDCYGKAIEILGRALSPDHPELIGPYNNMAALLSDQGNYDKALYYYGKVGAICKREGGDNHPYLMVINNNIANLLYAQGDYDKALDYCEKTFAILKRVTYPEYPMNASTYNIMGDVFIAQGNYVRALESYGKALAILQRGSGEEHPLLATTYKGFALVYLNQGKYSIALEYIDKALSIYEHKLGADHHETRAAEQVKDQIKISFVTCLQHKICCENDAVCRYG